LIGERGIVLKLSVQNLLTASVAMNATLLYRIAAIVFVLFAIGHTVNA